MENKQNPTKYSKKSSIILVLEILRRFSDETTFLTQNEIAQKIFEQYGLKLERKSIAASLKTLEDLGHDIIYKKAHGVALVERMFNESEAKYLIDLVFSSRSLSGNHALGIVNKIKNTLSIKETAYYDYAEKSKEINRTQNKEVFLNIEIINDAIKQNKWVGFKYMTYDEDGNPSFRFNGYVFHASPCALVSSQGRYYLLGYRYKYNSVNSYRIDYIKDIYIMEERERIPLNELDEFKDYENITQYINDHIYMFGGPIIEATLEIFVPHTLTYIYDWFGKNATFYKENNRMFLKIRSNGNALFYWLMQYSHLVKILSPESLKTKVIQAAKEIIEKYKN